VDVKVIKVAGQTAVQYTALDDCPRMRVLRLYRRRHQRSSLLLLSALCRSVPFPIRRLQTDRRTEFSLAFALSVHERGIRHGDIHPRCPEQNGKVERSHPIDDEAVPEPAGLLGLRHRGARVRGWERVYNEHRFSTALVGRTPREKLAAVLAATQERREQPRTDVPITSSRVRS
jgi:transposase InsO family protein